MLKVIRNSISVSLVLLLVCIFCSSAVSADDENIGASVEVEPTIDITMPDKLALDLDPSTSEGFNQQSLKIEFSSNNPAGYDLTVEPTGDNTNLTHVVDDTQIIPNITTTYSAENFPVNKWGFRATEDSDTPTGDYGPFTPGVIASSNEPINKKVVALGFGAKTDYTMLSGKYELGLNIKILPKVAPVYMQNLDPTVCTTTPTTVIDARDEQAYSIVRLPDGNCWMTKNLNLAGGTIITNHNSNITDTSYTLPALDNSSTSFTDDDTAYVYNSNNATCASGTPCYSYYSYAAATAGTNPSSGDAISDICPKGWRLPTEAEYATLTGTYTTGDALAAAPFNGVYAGRFNDGSFYSGGSDGRYWSSTTLDSDPSDAYDLVFITSTASSFTTNNKRYGLSVRCVLKES